MPTLFPRNLDLNGFRCNLNSFRIQSNSGILGRTFRVSSFLSSQDEDTLLIQLQPYLKKKNF
jgi:hypothetical protein